MRKIMVLQHVGHEPLGTLDPTLKSAGFRIRYINFARQPDIQPDIEGYNGLIVLGGPMGVYEAEVFPHLKVEMQVIERALNMDIPILGICLGAQLLAHVLGGQVSKGPQMELGWHDLHLTEHGKSDSLFQHYSPSEKIFQLHQDTFTPPKDSHHLAKSDLFEGQAFRFGKKVYGFQFHLEVDEPMIQRWLKVPSNRKMIQDSQGLYSEDQIRTETKNFIDRSLKLSHKTFAKFVEIFQLPERPERLGSEHAKPHKKGGVKI